MAWHKITIQHGPGHQGKMIRYIWRDHRLLKGGKEALFHAACDPYWQHPIGTVVRVRKLPTSVYMAKIAHANALIKEGNKLLSILTRARRNLVKK